MSAKVSVPREPTEAPVAWRWREHYNLGREDRWHLADRKPEWWEDVECQPLFAAMSTASMREAAAKVADAKEQSLLRLGGYSTEKSLIAQSIAKEIRALPDPAPQPGKEDQEVARSLYEEIETLINNGNRWRPVNQIVDTITAALAAVREASRVEGWRCFHCDEVFTDAALAREHFGLETISDPACQIDIAKFREMEALHARHLTETDEATVEFHRMRADHVQSLQREEERGYAKGTADREGEVARLRKALTEIVAFEEDMMDGEGVGVVLGNVLDIARAALADTQEK